MTLCDKAGYQTREAAINAIREISRRDKQPMKVYKCSDCQLFHAATEGKRKHIPVIRHGLNDIAIKKKMGAVCKPEPFTPSLSSEKLLSKDLANHLKRLIEGSNQLSKQRKK
jgi:hypothetical protein